MVKNKGSFNQKYESYYLVISKMSKKDKEVVTTFNEVTNKLEESCFDLKIYTYLNLLESEKIKYVDDMFISMFESDFGFVLLKKIDDNQKYIRNFFDKGKGLSSYKDKQLFHIKQMEHYYKKNTLISFVLYKEYFESIYSAQESMFNIIYADISNEDRLNHPIYKSLLIQKRLFKELTLIFEDKDNESMDSILNKLFHVNKAIYNNQ